MQKQLFDLQEKYLQTRKEKDYNNLYIEIYKLAESITTNKLKKCKQYDRARAEQVATDAASAFMLMYLKNINWKCRYFSKRLGMDVTHILYNRKHGNDRYFYEHTTDVIPIAESQIQTKEIKPCIMELLENDVDRGKVLIGAYKAKTYESFILKVRELKPMFWIYDNAVALHDLFRYTRHG